MNKQENCVMYHQQATIDKWAKEPDINLTGRIIETTMDAILECYNEFMADLMYEQQEAY